MIVTTTIEINSPGEMAKRLERKNNKAQLARALARIWIEAEREDGNLEKVIEEVFSNAVWGY